MPRQSTRLMLVNDVNFLLYTPFLPEAAAGTLEPRHVVTPLRDILKRTYLRLGSITGHDPAAKTVELRTRDGDSERLPYDQLLLALGSVSRVLPVPGLSEHAIGFKDLADAIWLRNHVIETLEAANASEDAARARGTAHLRLRRRRLRRPRGAGRAAGLRRRRDRELPARPSARDALGAGRGGRPGPARDRRRARRLRPARAARPRHRHPPRHDAGGGHGRQRPALDRRDAVDPHRRSGPLASHPTRACASSPCRSTSAAASPSTTTCGSRAWTRSGRSATAPRRPTRAVASVRRPPSTLCARGRSLPATSPPSSASASAAALRLPRQRLLRQPRPLQGGRQGRRTYLPRLPGLVDGPHATT